MRNTPFKSWFVGFNSIWFCLVKKNPLHVQVISVQDVKQKKFNARMHS